MKFVLRLGRGHLLEERQIRKALRYQVKLEQLGNLMSLRCTTHFNNRMFSECRQCIRNRGIKPKSKGKYFALSIGEHNIYWESRWFQAHYWSLCKDHEFSEFLEAELDHLHFLGQWKQTFTNLSTKL